MLANENGNITKEKKLNATHIILIVVASCLLVAAAILVVVLLNQNNTGGMTSGNQGGNVVVNSDDPDATPPYDSDNLFSISMTTLWTFANSDAISTNAILENSERNIEPFFVTIVIPDIAEPIFQSPVIPPGAALEDIKLTYPLEAGTYDAVCVYHLLDSDGNEMDPIQVAMTIVVNQ